MKASYLEVYKMFIAVAHKWAEGSGDRQAAIDRYKSCVREFDADLRKIGWTFGEFQNYETSPEEEKSVARILELEFPTSIEADTSEFEHVKDMSN